MTTWLVTEDQDGGAGWTIWRDGQQVADAAGIREAMVTAEMDAGRALTWRLTAEGFESVGPVEG